MGDSTSGTSSITPSVTNTYARPASGPSGASAPWYSGFLPRFLGVLLVVAGSAYVVESITWLLLPDYRHQVSRFTGPLRILELVTPLWLLIMGAKDQPLAD
jgi:hypothetical protein